MISKDSDFRREKSEILLLDTGAGVNLAGEDIIKDSGIKIYELQSERKVTEASGTILDIIGVCEMYIKLNCLKRKKINCLVLRGNKVDREILISYDTLLKWDMIHQTFGKETVTNFVNRNAAIKRIQNKINKLKSTNNSHSELYQKHHTATNTMTNQIPSSCAALREKILKQHSHNFKEKLGPGDRINHPPIHLNIDHTRGIKPIKQSKAYQVPLHLYKPAQKELNEMVEAGIIEPAEPEATGWSSMAFPRKKPGSDPVKVRWVTDFRDLNKALDRPVWGGESSSQILQRLDPRAKFFAVFEMMIPLPKLVCQGPC